MTTPNPYLDIQASLLAFCTKFKRENDLGDWETFDFDKHTTTAQLPANNLIGIGEFSLEDQAGTFESTCMFILCTQASDSDLKIMRDAVNKLHLALRPNKTLDTVMNDQGSIVGKLTVQPPVKIMPVANTSGRPLVAIAVQLGSTFLTPP